MFKAILLGIALAMDAFAVSIVNGIKFKNYDKKEMLLSSFSFGIFQGAMPLIGCYLFRNILNYIEQYDHWVILLVLVTLGIRMIVGSFKKEEIKEESEEFNYKILFLESIATSIDALSVGISLPSLLISPYLSALIICIITTIICLIGHRIGKRLGLLLKDKATIAGGIILIFIGIYTVYEHLGI